MDWLYYLCLIIVLLTGLFINVVGLPGLWLMVAAAALFGWWTEWVHLSKPGLVALLVLAVGAEIAEFVLGGAGAKEAGGSRRAFAGAIIGGIVGAIVLTIPIFVVGTILGACLGSAIGAVLAELTKKRELKHNWRVGVGAFKGRLYGIVSKVAFGVVMLAVAAIAALPLDSRPGKANTTTQQITTELSPAVNATQPVEQ